MCISGRRDFFSRSEARFFPPRRMKDQVGNSGRNRNVSAADLRSADLSGRGTFPVAPICDGRQDFRHRPGCRGKLFNPTRAHDTVKAGGSLLVVLRDFAAADSCTIRGWENPLEFGGVRNCAGFTAKSGPTAARRF